jgi:NADH:ubiquinone oxidoreductase subunit 6 (subunit J)
VPVFVLLGFAANYAFLLLFFPLIFAILYFDYSKNGREGWRFAHLGVTTVTAFAMYVYMTWAVYHTERVSKYNHLEAIAYMEEKLGHVLSSFTRWYISYAVFGIDFDSGRKLTTLDNTPWGSDFYANYFSPIALLTAILLCVSTLAFAFLLWKRAARKEQGFFNKSPYYLFMVAPLLLPLAYLIFWDIDRLAWSTLLTQTLFIAHTYSEKEKDTAFAPFERIKGRKRLLICVALLLCIAVPMFVFDTMIFL